METPANVVEALYERVEAYTKTTIELSKLKALNTTTQVVSMLISQISVIIMLSLFTLVMNVGIALWLGELLDKIYYGFFIVAAFDLIAGLVFHFFLHNWIKKPVSQMIITQALK